MKSPVSPKLSASWGAKDKGWCAIGSVKSNIGHGESAAGVAGVAKVLLQMKHGQLAPSLHSQTLNPNIDFANTPFVVQQELAEWRKPSVTIDGQTREYPRIAGISSFGAGGSNAHIVLEQYEAPTSVAIATHGVLVLSAKTADQLAEQAANLLAFIESQALTDSDLANLCYTLQVGREALEERAACTVDSMVSLKPKLQALASGTDVQMHWQRSAVKPSELAMFSANEELREAVDKWIARGKFNSLLELWVKGMAFDWQRLYGEGAKPKRISLPGYPFARERYWIDIPEDFLAHVQAQKQAVETEDSDYEYVYEYEEVEVEAEGHQPDWILQCLMPVWQAAPLAEQSTIDIERLSVLLCHTGLSEKPAWHGSNVENSDSLTGADTLAASAASLIEQVFLKVQNHLQEHGREQSLLQVVIGADSTEQVLRALGGLLATAQAENPRLNTQLLLANPDLDAKGLAGLLNTERNSLTAGHAVVRHVDGERQISHWDLAPAVKAAQPLWPDNGVYLITGGLGGLGQVVTRQIAAKSIGATVILTGRSALSDKAKARLTELEALGLNAEYRSVDVADKQSVESLMSHIQSAHGRLTGIFHSAGVNRDNFIINKSVDELRQVLAPKVAGLVNLDEASRAFALQYFIAFSSSAALGNPGQADYAAANGFMDAYMHYRAGLVEGLSLSFNWPLWDTSALDGGMSVDAASEAMMLSQGLKALPVEMGIEALENGMAGSVNQSLVLYRDLNHGQALAGSQQGESLDIQSLGEADQQRLKDDTVAKLTELFAEVSKVPVSRLSADEPLGNYGLDSIMIVSLNQLLAPIFGELSKTLMYEYETLAALGEYLLEDYAAECARWIGLDEASPSAVAAPRTERRRVKRKRLKAAVDDIAIIGLAGRYPGANNIDAYWERLKAGDDCISEIPDDRWAMEGFFEPDMEQAVAQGKSYSKWGGFIEGHADFDPLFFGISPREAQNVDPQERLFLTCCWQVIEDAGYTRQTLQSKHEGNVGVFAGITKTGYSLYGPALWDQHQEDFPYTSFSSVANRVSYLLNLTGPSMPIDTMCSASLTAIHEACEYLKREDCELAIAGGVNLYLHRSNYIALCGNRMLSIDGQCKSFGAGGNGFVPGEGVGAVLLKPLSKAEADGDHIYGLVKGSALNHGGKTSGYTVPSPNAQAQLIGRVLEKARVDARMISYIEAHGTGTELGDPIEITGLTKAFKAHSEAGATGYCAIGSVKSNIGHLEAAAGIAGVSKILLQMKHQQLVPSLHAQTLNPNIDFAKTPFVVQHELAPWDKPQLEIDGESKTCPRMAGISSFGAGGSNAHLILQEYEAPQKQGLMDLGGQPALLVLSAKTPEQLIEQAKKLLDHARLHVFDDADILRLCYTLQAGREAMEERAATTINTPEQLREKLAALAQSTGETVEIAGWKRGSMRNGKALLSEFAADEDAQSLVAAWLNKHKLDKLMDVWVKGWTLDWQQLYPEGVTPARISLPTYPFAKERYWVQTPQAVEQADGDYEFVYEYEEVAEPQVEHKPQWALQLSSPKWIDAEADKQAASVERRWVITHGVSPVQLPDAVCDHLDAADTRQLIEQVFVKVQSHLQTHGKTPTLLQVVVGCEDDQGLQQCLSGLLATAQQENPNLHTQLVLVDTAITANRLVEILNVECDSAAPVVCLVGGKRQVKAWLPADKVETSELPVYKANGVYLITGGLGGLGLIVANDIAAGTSQATVILTGRSLLGADGQAKLKALRSAGLKLEYHAVDVSNRQAVDALMDHIEANHGGLTGIFHGAGIIRDNFIINKSIDELHQVLPPKLDGVKHLDEASARFGLDWFVCFSAAAALGNPGQADYASANAFMDAYMHYRAKLVASGERQGKSLSFNWPLWRDGGMRMDEATEQALLAMGLKAMPTEQGLAALRHGLLADATQWLVIYGDVNKPTGSSVEQTDNQLTLSEDNAKQLKSKVLEQLTELFAKVCKADAARIDVHRSLEAYGLDSIMIVNFNQLLMPIFGQLSKTLLYEYETLAELGEYLTETRGAACASWVGLNAPGEQTVQKQRKRVKRKRLRAAQDDIAIIGLAGRYPGADNIDAYWQRLAAGDDCVSEIPAERWPLQDFFEADPDLAVEQAKSYSKWGGFIDGFAEFDPLFFGIAPREAQNMDPQERLFLTCCWQVLEDAGYTRSSIQALHRGRVGVFAGITKTGFSLYGPMLWALGQDEYPNTSFSSVANRVSYLMNLSGPSMPVDTMCSSSLTAIHEACETPQT